MEAPPVSNQAPAPDRPATFREVFGNAEYRAMYSAAAASWFGEYLARAAVTALVYQSTDSVAASAAAFATSYLPWVVGGPLLAAVAERLRYRAVMVTCDLIRMALVALVALPGTPVPLMIGLLFLVALANPPAQAARSALMPLVLTGDRLVVGLSLNQSTGQAAQVIGYMAGAAIAPFHPRLALVVDAITFGLSAVILRFGLRDRPPALPEAHRSHLVRETGDGYRMVFGSPVLRAIAVIVFCAMLFAIVPEGLAAAWATDLVGHGDDRGLIQGLIMVANPLGWIAGALLVGRLVAPETRRRLIRVFAVLGPLVLVPAATNPPVAGVLLMAAACGFCMGGMLPAANALFVQALPNGFRARAFGVMQSGVQVIQGIAVLFTGLLADMFPLHVVVGLWSAAGVVLLGLVSLRWPRPSQIRAAVAAAAEANAGGPGGQVRVGSDHTVPARRDPGQVVGPGPAGPVAAAPDPVDWRPPTSRPATNNHRPSRHPAAGGGTAADGGTADANAATA
jgi:MFS family permease